MKHLKWYRLTGDSHPFSPEILLSLGVQQETETENNKLRARRFREYLKDVSERNTKFIEDKLA
jgi:hypothetical protein